MEKVYFEGVVKEAIDKGLVETSLYFLVGVMIENGVKQVRVSDSECGSFGDTKVRMVLNDDGRGLSIEILEDDV